MLNSLEQRMRRQEKLVLAILRNMGIDEKEFVKLGEEDTRDMDNITLLCWHILRDIRYIDGLR